MEQMKNYTGQVLFSVNQLVEGAEQVMDFLGIQNIADNVTTASQDAVNVVELASTTKVNSEKLIENS